MSKQLADSIRANLEQYNNIVDTLELLLREARQSGVEVELLDGTNAEIAHDLDGLTGFKIRLVQIMAKLPL